MCDQILTNILLQIRTKSQRMLLIKTQQNIFITELLILNRNRKKTLVKVNISKHAQGKFLG